MPVSAVTRRAVSSARSSSAEARRSMTSARSVLLSVTPLRSFEEAEYLAHEVPDISIPASTLRAMERAGRGAARATGVKLAAELLADTRPVVGGAVLTAPDEDATALLPLLASWAEAGL